MSKVTIEKCLKNVGNRFELVLIASRRAREIALRNVKPLVDPLDDKPTIIALREIECGFNFPVNNYASHIYDSFDYDSISDNFENFSIDENISNIFNNNDSSV